MPAQLRHSEGVTRVLAAARELAQAEGASTVTARHVMQALWHDESRAHEILSGAGVSQSEFDARFPTGPTVESASTDVPPEFSTPVTSALRTARSWLRANLDDAELRTEHLLAALAQVDDVCELLLRDARIDPRTLRPDHQGAAASAVQIDPGDSQPIDLFAGEMAAMYVPEQPDRLSNGNSGSPSVATRPDWTAIVAGHDALRILDAAANRAREGLRVIEDFTRFVLNDAHLSRLLKEIRHELAAVLQQLGSDRWHALRDTPGDVGTAISTASESSRESAVDVVRANLKRLTEALRSLEEYGKPLDIAAASAIERLRYRCYTIEKAVLTTLASRTRLADARVYLLVTESLCRAGIENVIRRAMAGGVDVVQLREKGNWDRERIALAHEARRWTHEAGALLIINDRPDIAAVVEADGVHLGQEDLTVRDARRLVGPDRLIGVSTHSIEQARQAVLDGADYLGVGPVFPSQTKQFESLPGLPFVRQVAVEVSLPWFAIGGVNSKNVPELLAAGASRVAVSHAVCSADDPESAANELRTRMTS